MTTYWVSFRIVQSGSYQTVYERLDEAIRHEAEPDRWWRETTSFYVFQSEDGSDAIATRLKAAIRPAFDLVILGSFDKKICKVIGNNEDSDIYDLVDFAKRA